MVGIVRGSHPHAQRMDIDEKNEGEHGFHETNDRLQTTDWQAESEARRPLTSTT